MLGKLNVCLGFSLLHWRNWRPTGSLLVWCCAGLGKRHCGQSEPASLILQMQIFFLPSGCFSLTPRFWNFLLKNIFLIIFY